MVSFDELYRAYSGDVYRFSLYLSGNSSDAEDLTSETFVRTFAAPGTLRAATVKGYLLRIARNLFLQGRRQAWRRQPVSEEISDGAPGLEATVICDERLRHTLEALQQLTETDRSALLLRAVEGLSYDEIADALAIPVATLKVRIHRARLKLAQTGGSAAITSSK
jgi:RNA polymerase sigma-70 factor (ECF subfamily)